MQPLPEFTAVVFGDGGGVHGFLSADGFAEAGFPFGVLLDGAVEIHVVWSLIQ